MNLYLKVKTDYNFYTLSMTHSNSKVSDIEFKWMNDQEGETDRSYVDRQFERMKMM